MAAPEGLNKENARKWVTALWSGDYKQTKQVLTRVADDGEKSHCCLGVGCEVAVLDGVRIAVTATSHSIFASTHHVLEYDGISGVPPKAFWNWLGLEADDNHLWVGTIHLADANDDKGWTFEQIGIHLNNEWELGLTVPEVDA